ncbi:TPA: RHS repeat-associated core domain-containing protein [Serratia liquefaciens]|nr:RHS repeat-associated core domain-containing protein [Serratia liquefaciens]HBL6727745.1 RHS repeat-associated core domain-containing protein [Serratia liquefaciens]HEJ7996198.1 RHS repeat-associated core domain-containing protein [Serratia liquefaciens]
MHYNRRRYYDPDAGQFISRDPIGLTGGINEYQYAPNPVQWIDPLGLTCKCPCPGTFWADRSLPRDNHAIRCRTLTHRTRNGVGRTDVEVRTTRHENGVTMQTKILFPHAI